METIRFLLTLPKNEKIILESLAKKQNKKIAEYIRSIITAYLLSIGEISQQEAAKTKQIKQGGDKWKEKIKNATPAELEEIKKKRSDHAKKMRAARTAKNSVHIVGNNSGVIIAGDNAIIDKPHPK